MDSADPLARRCPFLPSRFPVRLKRTPTPSGGGPVFRQGHTSTYAPLLEPPNKLKGAVIYLKGSKAHVLMHQLGVLSRARLHLFQKLASPVKWDQCSPDSGMLCVSSLDQRHQRKWQLVRNAGFWAHPTPCVLSRVRFCSPMESSPPGFVSPTFNQTTCSLNISRCF